MYRKVEREACYTICVALALLGVISGHSDHKDKAGDVEKGLGIVVHPEYSILTGKYSCGVQDQPS
jgi:hypothetical protein